MRLIDADALKNLPFERMIHTDFGDTCVPIEEIDNAETIIPFASVETQTMIQYERPQGEWKSEGYFVFCDYCGSSNGNNRTPFCPYCGAEMKEGEDHAID